jgi:hypothetical protein
MATYQGKPVLSIAVNAAFFLAFTACLPGLLKRDHSVFLVTLVLICMNVLYGWIEALVIHPRDSLPATMMVSTLVFAIYASLILPRILKQRHS